VNSVPGWAFLVARGARNGYRAVLAPDFLVSERRHGLLTERVRGTEPDTATAVERITDRDGSTALTVTYRVEPAPAAELASVAGLDDVLLDEHGRPLEMLYGLVTTRPMSAGDQDMARARAEAIHSYRRFLTDEEGVAVQPSAPFALTEAAPVAPDPGTPPAMPVGAPPAAPVGAPPQPSARPVQESWRVPAAPHRARPAGHVISRGVALAVALLAVLIGAVVVPLLIPDAFEAVDVGVSLQDRSEPVAPLERPLCGNVRVQGVITPAGRAPVTYYWRVDGRAVTPPQWHAGGSPASFGVDGPDGYLLGSGAAVSHHVTVPRTYELVVSGDGRTWRSGGTTTITCVVGES
jgi:hypothetical protein